MVDGFPVSGVWTVRFDNELLFFSFSFSLSTCSQTTASRGARRSDLGPNLPPTHYSPIQQRHTTQAMAVLRLSEFSLSVGSTQLLDSVNAHLVAGQRVALVGPNGSGKSTLLRALVRRAGCGLGCAAKVRLWIPNFGEIPSYPSILLRGVLRS